MNTVDMEGVRLIRAYYVVMRRERGRLTVRDEVSFNGLCYNIINHTGGCDWEAYGIRKTKWRLISKIEKQHGCESVSIRCWVQADLGLMQWWPSNAG